MQSIFVVVLHKKITRGKIPIFTVFLNASKNFLGYASKTFNPTWIYRKHPNDLISKNPKNQHSSLEKRK
jgi:hypothetical protein